MERWIDTESSFPVAGATNAPPSTGEDVEALKALRLVSYLTAVPGEAPPGAGNRGMANFAQSRGTKSSRPCEDLEWQASLEVPLSMLPTIAGHFIGLMNKFVPTSPPPVPPGPASGALHTAR